MDKAPTATASVGARLAPKAKQAAKGSPTYIQLEIKPNPRVVIKTRGKISTKIILLCFKICLTWERKNEKLCPLMCDGVTTRVNSYNIPIGLYFNSVNLEHVTQGKILPWDKKDDAADDLIDQYENNIEGLFQIFKDKTISDNLKDSWEALKESEWRVPYSNVNILFEKIRQINEG